MDGSVGRSRSVGTRHVTHTSIHMRMSPNCSRSRSTRPLTTPCLCLPACSAKATGTPPTAALSSSGRLAEASGAPDTPPPAGPRRVRLLLNGDVVIPGALDPGLDGRGRGRSLTRGSLSPKPGAVRRQGSVVGGGGGGGAAVMRSPSPSPSPSQFDFLPSPTAANVPQLASTPIPGRISVSTTPQLAPTTKPIPRSPKAGGGGPPSSPSSQQRSW